ncbi:hypothetical protein QYF61_026737 [Mycteria americana]|uniref:Ig-like domain-containing protein n=1 Tax=Mycteria americana TaxID=33587 RepID=A0AAN7RSL4_MYCAM|nr:hypothetical protein QYF61_026737 [Mycteria americana]
MWMFLTPCSFPACVLVKPAVPPKLKKLKSPNVHVGEKISLKCEATAGNPQPSYKWFKDGKELKKSKDIRIKYGNGKKISRLQFNKVKLEDAGEYSCEAENILGKDTAKGSLNVKSGTTKAPQVLPASETKIVVMEEELTTTLSSWSGHARKCNETAKSYCVNGGVCYYIEGINQLSCKRDILGLHDISEWTRKSKDWEQALAYLWEAQKGQICTAHTGLAVSTWDLDLDLDLDLPRSTPPYAQVSNRIHRRPVSAFRNGQLLQKELYSWNPGPRDVQEQENLSAMVADAWNRSSMQGKHVTEGGVEFFPYASSTSFLTGKHKEYKHTAELQGMKPLQGKGILSPSEQRACDESITGHA